MHKSNVLTRFAALAAAAVILASACNTRAPADLEEVKANQKKILEKLAALEKKAGEAARPAPRQRPGRPDPGTVYAMPVGDAHAKGPADAWVTIVEVSDFQCPFCGRVTPTIGKLLEKYGSEVRVVFKHNPLSFHKRARPAALAAECAGEQGKFWEMHDQLFSHQRALEDAQLEEYAAAIGLEVSRWRSCFSSGKFGEKLDRHQKEAVALGARGTPAFFINGRFLSGAQPLQNFEKLIDEELAKAKKSGVPKAEYYQKEVLAKGVKKI